MLCLNVAHLPDGSIANPLAVSVPDPQPITCFQPLVDVGYTQAMTVLGPVPYCNAETPVICAFTPPSKEKWPVPPEPAKVNPVTSAVELLVKSVQVFPDE